MSDSPLLCIHKLQRSVNKHILWRDISLDLYPGEIWFVRGPSGVGKTLFLRAIACLDPLESGIIKLKGQTPSQIGMTCWRADIAYVHQSRVNFKGSARDLFHTAQNFCSQKGRPRADIEALMPDLGLDPSVLDQQWSELSGGQAQRVHLAIAIALKPQVLLLDEPTSACDHQAALRVEAVLKSCSAAVIWVTHDPAQPDRVGGKTLELPSGSITTVAPNAASEGEDSCKVDKAAVPAGVQESTVQDAGSHHGLDSSSDTQAGEQQQQQQ